MKKLSVSIDGHATSISLEEPFLEALNKIAIERGVSVASIVKTIDRSRKPEQNLSSSIRVYVLNELTEKLARIGKSA